ncbi:MAG: hypothetical protein ABI895_10310 [Deltaproteobacteria bacterium]
MAVAWALLMGCDSAAPERVAIVAHYVPACAPSLVSAPSQLELIALGDFDRSNESVSIVSSNASLRALALPADTRAVELSTLGDRGYWGTGTLDTHNQIPVLLWPREQACELGRLSVPSPGAEWLLGATSRSRELVCLSTLAPATEGASVGLWIQLGTAQVTELAANQGLASPRRFASMSELGERLVVAGGIDPASNRYHSDAELFDPVSHRFEPERLALAVPRAHHAALGLPSGATLLIGGESEEGGALASVELISPDATRTPRALQLLATPRIAPRALLLGDGRILVGGGYTWLASARDPRAGRQPIASVEFLSFDLTDRSSAPTRLEPAALDRAFVELVSGSTLALGGCDPLGRESGCLPCGAGPGCISRDVWWIDPQGTSHALEPLPVELAAPQPELVAAAEGSPWLLANGRVARFDPWLARFVAAPDVLGGSLALAPPGPLALGPGLFVWARPAADSIELYGWHSSQRGPLTQDVAPLLVGSGLGLVPHRPPTEAGADGEVTLRYGVATGLELSGSSAVASIADTDYGSFTLDLSLAAGPAPLLRLAGSAGAAGETTSFGGLECAWPDFNAPEAAGPVRLRVQREGDAVSLLLAASVDTLGAAANAAPCRRPLPERVRIELLGTPLGTTRLTRIEIRRTLGEL